MKKSLLALAVLGAFAGVASAQSTVTLFGIIDLNGRYVKNDDSDRRLSLSQDGINSSRFGVRGVEDLGGGLKAGFHLEAGVNADTGNANSQFWNRRSTVSLLGNFGEVRLGRDYVPTFWNTTVFDAFGTNGVGDSAGIKQMLAPIYSRSNNAIGYFLPTGIGGLYGQFTAAAGEGSSAGRYLGGRVGFAAGPFDVAVAYGQERLGSVTFPGLIAGGAQLVVPVTDGEKYKTVNVGGSYDFGFLKLMGYVNQEKLDDLKDRIFSISAVIPFGQSEIHVGGERSKAEIEGVGSNTVKKFALGYVYNLSKRTALYGTVAIVDNGDDSQISLGSVGSSAEAYPTAGGKSKGFEVGLRHIF